MTRPIAATAAAATTNGSLTTVVGHPQEGDHGHELRQPEATLATTAPTA